MTKDNTISFGARVALFILFLYLVDSAPNKFLLLLPTVCTIKLYEAIKVSKTRPSMIGQKYNVVVSIDCNLDVCVKTNAKTVTIDTKILKRKTRFVTRFTFLASYLRLK